MILLTQKAASYPGLCIEIHNGGKLKSKLHEKRDDFTFPKINFSFISSNFPVAHVYGVYVSQRICYSRACTHYSDFLDRAQLLTQQLIKQGYVAPTLKSAIQNAYVCHHQLVDRYEISISQKIMDIFPLHHFYQRQDFYRTWLWVTHRVSYKK